MTDVIVLFNSHSSHESIEIKYDTMKSNQFYIAVHFSLNLFRYFSLNCSIFECWFFFWSCSNWTCLVDLFIYLFINKSISVNEDKDRIMRIFKLNETFKQTNKISTQVKILCFVWFDSVWCGTIKWKSIDNNFTVINLSH